MLRIKGLVGCEVIRNSSCGFTKHIGHNRIQCYIADCERILKAVFLAAFHGYQLIAVAGKLTQNADIQVGDEAAFYKANAKQIPNPLGIFRIILVSLYSLYPFWVRYYNPNATLFKDVEYRNPVLSGGFHADIQTVVFQKPICETVQVRIEGAESLFLIVGLQAVCGRGDDGSNQECLVNIYTSAGWEYDFHNKTSSIIIVRRMQGLNRQAINRC